MRYEFSNSSIIEKIRENEEFSSLFWIELHITQTKSTLSRRGKCCYFLREVSLIEVDKDLFQMVSLVTSTTTNYIFVLLLATVDILQKKQQQLKTV